MVEKINTTKEAASLPQGISSQQNAIMRYWYEHQDQFAPPCYGINLFCRGALVCRLNDTDLCTVNRSFLIPSGSHVNPTFWLQGSSQSEQSGRKLLLVSAIFSSYLPVIAGV